MKKHIFLSLTILSFIILSQFVSSETNQDSITGNMIVDPVTGKLTSQQVGMSIFIQTIIPYIQLISPKNQTYLKNESLLINYTLVNGDYIWYNLDNSENITISSSKYINVSQGKHTLYIFSNNSNISTSSSITFTINSSRFVILFEDYKGINNGASTNFIDYTYEEIQNLDNIIIENTNYGKIQFNEEINVTNDNNFADNLLDLDSNTEISFNHIELNSTELQNFNKPAIIWLYNLTFTNPRILKDGTVCPSTICTKESYTYPSNSTGGTLKFNVTSFSIYSTEETPISTAINGGGGGGGGTEIAAVKEKKFEIKPEEIKISLKQGETISKKIFITNLEDQILKFELTNSSLKDFIKINETEFYMNPKESKEIEVNFITTNNTLPELYIGKIFVMVEDTQKEILVAIEVESKVSLFDIKMKIPNKYKYVLPGEEVLAQIELYNIGSDEKVDVSLNYIIKDDKGNEIVMDHDTLAVGTTTSFTKKVQLPKDLTFGEYVFYVKLTYEDKTASASSWFNVGKAPTIPFKAGIIALVVVLAMGLIIIIIRIRKIKEHSSISKKIDTGSLKRAKIIKE